MKLPQHRISLEELGEPELFVVMKDPGVLPWKYTKRLSKNPDPEMLDDMFAKLIVSWNLTDEEGNLLAIPSEDKEVLDQIPSGVLVYLLEEVTSRSSVSKRRN